MAINLKRTSALARDGVKILVYGQAGAGKTSLICTLPKPITLSAEAGLLSIAGADLPYIEIGNIADLTDALEWLTSSGEAAEYQSVALDSISEIAEVVASIAEQHLGLETLDEQHSDSLDFHEVAVWDVRAALAAAYAAGAEDR